LRKAVIDVGSNSVLLLVGEKTDLGWKPILEDTAVTALGEGTKQTGVLGEQGMSRTLEALHDFFEKAKRAGAGQVRAVATMAARIATNAEGFQKRAEEQSTPIEILSGEDEAQLGFEAVANDPTFKDCRRLSIVDPGGHSTELVTADREDAHWNVRFRRSYPVGTLALRGDLLQDASPNPLLLLKACQEIDDEIGLCYRPHEHGTVVTLGATGTNLVSIRDRLTTWQPELVHGARLDYEEVSKAVGWLSTLTDEQRAAVPGMESGRQKTIHLGALILERFLFALRAPECYVSVKGWRHALLERS